MSKGKDRLPTINFRVREYVVQPPFSTSKRYSNFEIMATIDTKSLALYTLTIKKSSLPQGIQGNVPSHLHFTGFISAANPGFGLTNRVWENWTWKMSPCKRKYFTSTKPQFVEISTLLLEGPVKNQPTWRSWRSSWNQVLISEPLNLHKTGIYSSRFSKGFCLKMLETRKWGFKYYTARSFVRWRSFVRFKAVWLPESLAIYHVIRLPITKFPA